MIAFNFEYYKPDDIDEALDTYQSLVQKGKKVLYYGGGTEFISMARVNNVYADAVIDIKGIPECSTLLAENSIIIIGSGITLTRIVESNIFPLLGQSSRRVADHTIQGKITLGGNLCGTIIYRESVLPLLLCDSKVIIASANKRRTVSINEVFNKRMNLEPGEFIVQIVIDKEYALLPYAHVKRTKQDKIDYPLITSAALKKDNKIRIAFSGLCQFPFRSREVENALNDLSLPEEVRINNAIQNLPEAILNDDAGSSGYREFVLVNIIRDTFKRLGGVNC